MATIIAIFSGNIFNTIKVITAIGINNLPHTIEAVAIAIPINTIMNIDIKLILSTTPQQHFLLVYF